MIHDCSRLRWCVGMASALSGVPENHEGKGLSPSRGWFTNDTRGALRRWVTYHAAPRDRGLIVNYCPLPAWAVTPSGREALDAAVAAGITIQ